MKGGCGGGDHEVIPPGPRTEVDARCEHTPRSGKSRGKGSGGIGASVGTECCACKVCVLRYMSLDVLRPPTAPCSCSRSLRLCFLPLAVLVPVLKLVWRLAPRLSSLVSRGVQWYWPQGLMCLKAPGYYIHKATRPQYLGHVSSRG